MPSTRRQPPPASPQGLSIVLCGEAGQGVQTIEVALASTLKAAGFHVFSTKEYMSRVRGGVNSTEIRVGSSRVAAFVDRIDILIPLTAGAMAHLADRISKRTLILGERAVVGADERITDVAFTSLALEAGNRLFANTVAVGLVLGLLKVDFGVLERYLQARFGAKAPDVVTGNIAAGRKGYDVGNRLATEGVLKTDLAPDSSVASELLLNGGEAVTFGAIAGGCNFVSSYPMSPSTPVLTGMAQATHEFDIVVEQAEDEIAAINMALGASYAGGRAMVTTSGGGFALMCEGVSLAGMIETPVVIHLAQRPGPATGLPTRTEQADLDLALYAGHGEFPRAIFAPGTLEQAFRLTARAFDQADKHQSPAFVLTDQYLIDSFYNTPGLAMPQAPVQRIVTSAAGYMRYAAARGGVSPRAIPGNGEGLVRVDSDEHTEEGLITESAAVRIAMQRKRMAKLTGLRSDSLPPELAGPATYRNLVVCWGSTYHIVKEALSLAGRKDLAALHFSQVYPLAAATSRYLRKARGVFVLENNATGQFANLLQREFNRKADGLILQYDGLPFCVEDVARELRKI